MKRETRLTWMLLGALWAGASSARAMAQAAVELVGGVLKVPAYDVVSIKPNKTGPGRTSISVDDGNFEANNVSLKQMIMAAYGLKESQIAGIPAWANSARFDIKAKVVEPDKEVFKKMTEEQNRMMLQPVLTERFQLEAHRETKVQPVYDLVIAKGGPKFKASAVSDGDGKTVNGMSAGSMRVHNRDMTAVGVGMNALANELSSSAQRLVVDKTGLTGKYDLQLKWSADDGPPTEADAVPGLFTALQEQLGLKLEAAKADVESFVIDRAVPPVED